MPRKHNTESYNHEGEKTPQMPGMQQMPQQAVKCPNKDCNRECNREMQPLQPLQPNATIGDEHGKCNRECNKCNRERNSNNILQNHLNTSSN